MRWDFNDSDPLIDMSPLTSNQAIDKNEQTSKNHTYAGFGWTAGSAVAGFFIPPLGGALLVSGDSAIAMSALMSPTFRQGDYDYTINYSHEHRNGQTHTEKWVSSRTDEKNRLKRISLKCNAE